MRRFHVSLLSILATAALIVAGCTNTNGEPASQKPNPGSEAAANSAPQPPVELSIGLSSSMDYNNYAKKNDRTDWPAVKELQKRTNVNITFKTYASSEADTLMNTEFAAGSNLSDIMLTSNQVHADVLLMNGVTIDLLPLIKEHAPHMQALMEKYPNIIASHMLDDGRMFSFPRGILDPTANLPAVMLRQDWMENLGLKEPTTIEEFTDVLRAFKTRDPNGDNEQNEVPLTGGFWWFINYLKPGFGLYDSVSEGDIYFFPDDNGKFQLQLARPEYKAFITWVNTLYEENLIDHKMFEPGDQRDAVTAIMTTTDNLGGLIWWSNSVRGGFTEYLVKQNPDALLTVVTPPKSSFVDKVQVQRNDPLDGHAIIAKSAKDPVAAITFMDYGFSPEGIDLANWGIEGDSYTIVDGKKVATEKINQPRPRDPNWYFPEAYGIHGWLTVQDFSVYAQIANWTQMDYDANDKMANIATAPDFPSLNYTDEERELYNTLRTDITTFADENILKFIIGAQPLSGWDTFVNDLSTKYKGQELIDKVYQPAYERYLKQINDNM